MAYFATINEGRDDTSSRGRTMFQDESSINYFPGGEASSGRWPFLCRVILTNITDFHEWHTLPPSTKVVAILLPRGRTMFQDESSINYFPPLLAHCWSIIIGGGHRRQASPFRIICHTETWNHHSSSPAMGDVETNSQHAGAQKDDITHLCGTIRHASSFDPWSPDLIELKPFPSIS